MAIDRDELELRETARLLVRAGLRDPEELERDFVAMVGEQMPHTDPVIMAKGWLLAARREHAAAAAAWAVPGDHERLGTALDECRGHSVAVLEGVADLQEVRAVVEAAAPPLRGVLWYDEPQVFDAIQRGVLLVGLRHGNGAPAVAGDPLASAVQGCLQRFGLASRPVAGGLEIACWWQRRP